MDRDPGGGAAGAQSDAKEDVMDTTTTTETMVEKIGGLPEKVGAEICFGQPIERDGHTLIPVARVSFGFGMGFGRGAGAGGGSSNGHAAFGEDEGVGEGEGGGGGGGGSSSPVAVIDITRDSVVIEPVIDRTRIRMAYLMLGAWAVFWLFLTVRTFPHERTKRHKAELKEARG
jgi:uncharacterized spore protein YtfJ